MWSSTSVSNWPTSSGRSPARMLRRRGRRSSSAGRRRSRAGSRDGPAAVCALEGHEAAGRKAGHAGVGIACDEQADEALEVGEVADEHDVVALALEAPGPDRGIVV